MRTTNLLDASRLKKLGIITAMALAMAACGGGGGGDDSGGGGGGGGGGDGPEEQGCLEGCKKFMAALVDDFAGGAAPAAMSTKAAGDGLDIIVEGDKVTFAVASVAIDSPRAGEYGAAFPVSGDELKYKLSVDKTTGEITVDNNDGKSYTFKAYEEASYFQEIDYAQTDLADKNKAHYAYLRFDPKATTNSLNKDALLRRQWRQVDGEDYPSPGVSIMLNTHHEDCPGKQDICDVIMLTANPEMHKPDDGDNDPPTSGPHITATVDGTVYEGTQNIAGTNYQPGLPATLAASTTSNDNWSIQHLMTEVGTYTCGKSGEVGNVTFMNTSKVASDPLNSWKFMNLTSAHSKEGGKCSVTVTKADDTAIEGTFTATVVGLGPANQVVTYSVTNGSFSVPKN